MFRVCWGPGMSYLGTMTRVVRRGSFHTEMWIDLIAGYVELQSKSDYQYVRSFVEQVLFSAPSFTATVVYIQWNCGGGGVA